MGESKFDAVFFDGKTSKPKTAELLFGPRDLIIVSHDPDGMQETVLWEYKKIQRSDIYQSGSKVTLRFGDFAAQTLEIQSDFFLQELQKRLKKDGPVNTLHQKALKNKTNVTVLILIALGGLAALYFFAVPFLGDLIGANLPYSMEQKLGSFLGDAMLDKNVKRSENLTRFAAQLKLDPKYPLEILYSSDTEVTNAFALMGGKIVVYQPILSLTKSPEELAGLLAHEYGHIRLKHSSRSIIKSMLGYFIISILINDMSGLSAVLLQNADSLRNLQYSRQMEEEADKFGLKLLEESGINPEGMPSLFKQFEKLERSKLPEFLVTHPNTKSRITYLNEMIKKSPPVHTNKPKLVKLYRRIMAEEGRP